MFSICRAHSSSQRIFTLVTSCDSNNRSHSSSVTQVFLQLCFINRYMDSGSTVVSPKSNPRQLQKQGSKPGCRVVHTKSYIWAQGSPTGDRAGTYTSVDRVRTEFLRDHGRVCLWFAPLIPSPRPAPRLRWTTSR